MTVKPYNQEDGKKQQVEQMFDSISQRYDFLNRSLSFGIDVLWRKKMVRELKNFANGPILDIATGTADVAIEISKNHASEITGIDVSEGMLSVGRLKISKRNLDKQITLIKGDAENLPFEKNSFACATVAFGVRNFENLNKGLEEIHRVLKPGGKLVVLEFSKPKVFPIKQLYDFYFKYFCPWWGKLLSKDASAYTYLYESVKAFPEGNDFLKIAKEAGFNSLHLNRVTFGIVTLYTGIK